MGSSLRLANEQNSEPVLRRQRAVAVAHNMVSRIQTVSLVVSAVVAGLSALARSDVAWSAPIALTGAFWAALYAIALAPLAGYYQRLSAALQETLEVNLFRLPWNEVAAGEPVPEDEIGRLARRYRGSDERLWDYFLVADVPEPYDVLFCFEQNLAWGARLRRRYAIGVGLVTAAWCVAGVVVGVVADLTVAELLGIWFVPALGLVFVSLDIVRTQLSASRERARVLRLLHAHEGPDRQLEPDADWITFARRIQDAIFQVRRQQPRLPVWFFRRSHDSDKRDFEIRMRGLEERLRGGAHATP
jgi:SMODS-associating 4TM effector domain